MSNITEQKEEITFNEFAAWLNGLIRGKGGALPDLDDWKQIKKMIEKVQPEKEYIAVPERKLPYHSPEIQYIPTPAYEVWWLPNTENPPFTSFTSNQVTITQPDAFVSMNQCNNAVRELSYTLDNITTNNTA